MHASTSLRVVTATAVATLSLVLPVSAEETVLGVYVFHRHGDRFAKSWPPTVLTALGADEVYSSGSYYRSRYVSENATNRIVAMAPDLVQLSQGLYPPAGGVAQQTLANGSVVEAPLGGYQYIPINVATSSAAAGSSSEDSTWLEGGSGCENAVISRNSYLLSLQYQATLNAIQDFYQSLLPAINTTFNSASASFKSAYTIYDYVHVSEIHNVTISGSDVLTDAALFQLQTRADQHEWGLACNSSDPVRAIAGAVLAAQILQGLNATEISPSSAPHMSFQFGTYATFMSFFVLANLPAASPQFYGVVDYAASMAFELVTNASVSTTLVLDPSDISVRFMFSNGSAALTGGLTEFALFGQAETVLPWSTFATEMSTFAVGDTASWCKICGNSTGVCSASSLGTSSTSDSGSTTTGSSSGNISRPVAGVIGAMVTFSVILGLKLLAMLLGGLRVVKKDVAAAGKVAQIGL
ncbi:hypothetical protein SCUCBS95973_008965 [Sporothrix curviconia]|uniref:Acid phosphatase n=1 Tax=Sporothrix curviconia TaxID=1260050 RepID=A0ABP0CT90_9PEZI